MPKISYFSTSGYKGNPLGDLKDSQILAKNIESYYHTQGLINVKCEVVKETRPIVHWVIRSNLLFDASEV